ncbi:MAG: histidine kinase [Bacteroidales bacterium]|nr:histidine kinase [Bacteroidales bacterium]
MSDNLIRLISIFFIGIIMPVIFYDKSDIKGLLLWIVISVIMTFVFWEGSIRVVSYIWHKFPFEKNIFIHIAVNFLYLSVLSVFIIALLYLIHLSFSRLSDNYWQNMTGVHVAVVLVSFFTTSIHEGIFIFNKWKESLVLSAKLEKENIQSQLDVLKNQLNPHFLFNSLSILSSIIPVEPEKAVIFVNKLSDIFRYTLEFRDENIVELKEEIDFVNSYIFLQKMRYSNNLKITNNIREKVSGYNVLPFSIQIIIENAIKHNEISDKYPLFVEISNTDEYITVKNNIQRIDNEGESFNVGLKNLTERYRLISDLKPLFYEKDKEFIAEIPILKNKV